MYSEPAKQAKAPKLSTLAINITIIQPQRLKLIQITRNPLPQTLLL